MSPSRFSVQADTDGFIEAVVTDQGRCYVESEEGVVEFHSDSAMAFDVDRWPAEVGFRVLEDGNTICLDAVITVSEEEVTAHVTNLIYRKYWDHAYGAGRFAEALQKAIQMRAAREGDVRFEYREDDGAWINIRYDLATGKEGSAWDAYLRLKELDNELWAHAERLLSGAALDHATLADEKRFTIEVLLPLFRSLGFSDVSYNHGRDEYGRDITFSETTRLGLRRNYGVQVKAGDMSGKADSELDTIIGQIEDAYSMPYVDVFSRDRRYVSDVLVVISGRFTHNAKEKIAEKVDSQNLYFVDIDKVQELLTGCFG